MTLPGGGFGSGNTPPLGPPVRISEEERRRAAAAWRRLAPPQFRALLDAPVDPEDAE